MPCDYRKYPKNWKSKIRPDILERAGHKCEVCNIPNGIVIERGFYNDAEAYQDVLKDEGAIYKAENSEYITHDYLGMLENPSGRIIKIVLTIAHLDHNIDNNDYSNLKAMCQLHHNRHDVGHRKNNRSKNKGQLKLEL